MKNLQYSSFWMGILLSSVVNAADDDGEVMRGKFKLVTNVDDNSGNNDLCMGYNHIGDLYLYDCNNGLEVFEMEFNRTSGQFKALSGHSAGQCLQTTLDIFPTFGECNPARQDQHWRFNVQDRTFLLTTADEDCLMQVTSSPQRLKVFPVNTNSECLRWESYIPEDNGDVAGTSGDPVIMGLQGQKFKFDGRDGGWYTNLAIGGGRSLESQKEDEALKFQWNMKFKQFPTCPKGDDMFVSSLAYNFFPEDKNEYANNDILIVTTPHAIPQCEDDSAVCLGDGTLHISFDGGETYVSNPADFNFANGRGRLVAHNTYEACSRKWFDYSISRQKEIEAAAGEAKTAGSRLKNQFLRGSKNMLSGNSHSLSTDAMIKGLANPQISRELREVSQEKKKKASLQYLLEKKRYMIEPKECESWIAERQKQNDLFLQRGQWSTIHIETPDLSLHIEYRRNNLHMEEDITKGKQCPNFQSLDAWMTDISPELNDKFSWYGVLGETKTKLYFDSAKEQQILHDRSLLLRGKNDSDYEVDGPFAKQFNAHYIL